MTRPGAVMRSKSRLAGHRPSSSFGISRPLDDAGPSRHHLQKSISVADIRHPHLNQRPVFEPIDEDAGEALGEDPACHARPSQAGQEPSAEPMPPLGSAEFATGKYPQEKMMGHETAADELHPDIVPRSLPYSRTSDLNFLNSRPAPVPRSTTIALPAKGPPQTSSGAASYDSDEINRKVAAMLAATEALKPKSPARSTKKKTMRSKVFSKLGSLFGSRRKNKSGEGKKKAVYSANSGTGEVGHHSARHQQPFSTKVPYIPGESAESRDLTPDRPVERRIPRKPVPNVHLQAYHANVGDPCSSRRTTADPAQETGRARALEVCTADGGNNAHGFAEEHGEEEDEDCGGSQNRIGDPFESERSFDNLQGFLTAQPIGASTPRGSKDWSVGVKPPQDYFSPPERISQFSANDADDELTEYEGRRPVSQRRQGKAPEGPVIRVQTASTSAGLDRDDAEPDRAKKHPSPSKASLEELSSQFNALLYNQNSRGEPSTSTTTGLSPVTAAFPRPPARIPASQTSALGTAEYRGLVGASRQAFSVPLSPTAQQLGTSTTSVKAPAIRPPGLTAERRHAPRQLASGGPGALPSRYRTAYIDEQQEGGKQYDHRLRRA